jgi:PSP1-like protein
MNVVGIRLGTLAKARSCDPAGFPLEVGETCLVDTEHGVQLGTVSTIVLSNPHFPEGSRLAQAKIQERAIPMKLGAVDRDLAGRRITLYFTSEVRVDFRDLVRDLTTEFHVRVELKQIGDREDAQMRGGCGPCGKTLCCSTHLKGFDPISIKMAKSQGLSLNPSKISGMCGRLMCCLKYEYDPETRAPKKKTGGCAVNRGPDAAPGDASTAQPS